MDQYVGEIRMFAGNFAPMDWAFCDGQLLPISQYEVLFTLIGTTYGGDGQTTFALPDLRGRIPISMGQLPNGGNYLIGQKGGTEQEVLNINQIPSHTHSVVASADPGTIGDPKNAIWAKSTENIYTVNTLEPNEKMNESIISNVGANQPHQNMMPYLGLNFIIALEGYYPSFE